jgi:hypothetical protein
MSNNVITDKFAVNSAAGVPIAEPLEVSFTTNPHEGSVTTLTIADGNGPEGAEVGKWISMSAYQLGALTADLASVRAAYSE